MENADIAKRRDHRHCDAYKYLGHILIKLYMVLSTYVYIYTYMYEGICIYIIYNIF